MNSSFNSDSRWSHMRAPTSADLALLARKVWEAVPMSLRDLTGEIHGIAMHNELAHAVIGLKTGDGHGNS